MTLLAHLTQPTHHPIDAEISWFMLQQLTFLVRLKYRVTNQPVQAPTASIALKGPVERSH